jgi:hypothetical protein
MMLGTGEDWITGIPLDRPGAGPLEKVANRLHYVATSLPPLRHVEAAAREAQAEGTTLDNVLQRLVTGGVYQDIDQDVAMARAVRRALAEGYREGERKRADRDEARRAGEVPLLQFSPEELQGASGAARAKWQVLAADLLELNERAGADASPDAPGAAERAQGPFLATTIDRRGINVVPTTALLNQWGPDQTLKVFFSLVGNSDESKARSEMAAIARQLAETDQRWETPLAVMQVLQAAPPSDVDVDVLKRLEGLAGAKRAQRR